MKKFIYLALVLFSATGLFAQETTIEKSDFDAALSKAFVRFAGQSYRRTESSRDILPNENQNRVTTKSFTEFAPRARRSFYQFDSPTVKTKKETIVIDGKTYTRLNDGEWTDKKIVPEKPSERKLEEIESKTEYKSLGTEILDNRVTSVYARIDNKKFVNTSNNRELLSTNTTKFWLDEKGGLVKEETQTESRMKAAQDRPESVYRTIRTSFWEIDPTIKIEAPVVAAQ